MLLLASRYLCNHSRYEGEWALYDEAYDEAVLAANDAKKWSIIGIVAGVIGSILYLVFCGGLAALSSIAGAH